jgi:hypothetical protein
MSAEATLIAENTLTPRSPDPEPMSRSLKAKARTVVPRHRQPTPALPRPHSLSLYTHW